MKNKFVKEYFSFSVRERNGLVVLCIILLAVVAARFIIVNQKNDSEYNFEQFEDKIDGFLAGRKPVGSITEFFNFDPNSVSADDMIRLGFSSRSIKSICNYRDKGGKFNKPEDLLKIYNITEQEYENLKDYIVIKNTNSSQRRYSGSKNENPDNRELFIFDPNISTKEDFEKLGLKSWQIENIIKYRQKGGKFIYPHDFLKIYGINETEFNLLKPYIKISVEEVAGKELIISGSEDIINLNTANEIELQKIKGIGPAYSKRIVEYRNKLGGYIDVMQLLEVYGFTEDMVLNLKDKIYLDLADVKKININTAGYADLISHPYIDKDNAKKILNYRNFAKEIKSFDELLKQKAVSGEFYNKLLPYIEVE